jgi:hypothetical protein
MSVRSFKPRPKKIIFFGHSARHPLVKVLEVCARGAIRGPASAVLKDFPGWSAGLFRKFFPCYFPRVCIMSVKYLNLFHDSKP